MVYSLSFDPYFLDISLFVKVSKTELKYISELE